MDEAKTITATPVSVQVIWDRIAPLMVLGYQVLALIAMAAALFLALSWFSQPTLGIFFDPHLVEGSVQTGNFPWEDAASQQGFTSKSNLVSIDGQRVASTASLRALLGQYQPSDQVELILRARSGITSTRTATLANHTLAERVMYFYLPFGVGAVFLLAGFWVVRMRQEDPAARSFGILTASAAFVLAGWFDVWTTNRLVPGWLAACGVLAGALLHFIFVYPRPLALSDRYPSLPMLGYLVGIGLAISSVAAYYNFDNLYLLGDRWQVLFIFLAVSFGVFFVGTIVRRVVGRSPVEMEQTRILIWANGVALIPLVVYLLARALHLTDLNIPLIVTATPFVLLPIALGYAILRYRVVNTDFLISQALLYLVLTLLAGSGYALLISGTSLLFQDLVKANNPFLVGIVVFILALMVNPFRSRVQLVIDTLFFRGEGVYRRYVETFSAEITQAVELSEITSLLREYIHQHVEPARLHIFVYDHLVDRYVATSGEDQRPTTDIRFPRNSGLVHLLSSKRTTLFLEGDEALPQELRQERARLALLGAQLFLALSGQERLSGWLALGPRVSGGRFTSQDMEFLAGLAEHAAIAIERAQVMADKDRRVHEMNVLTRVAQGVNVTINFDDILELLYAQTSQVIPVDDFNITLHNATTNVLRHVFLLENEERLEELENEIIPLGHGLEREVLENRRMIMTDDYQQECRNRRIIPTKRNVYAWMGVPLNAGAEVIGVIAVASRNPAVLYTEDQYNILQAVADQAAGAIVKARLLDETETRARQLASLNEVTRGLTSTLELDPLLQNVMNSAVEILNCQAGSLLLVDRETNELVYEVVVGPVADEFLGDRQPIGVGLAGKVALNMQPMIVNNVEQSPDWDSEPDQETGFITQGMLVVPMIYKNSVIGVLEVLNKKNRMPFTADDQELLAAFAGQAAVAVENVRLYTQTDQELATRVEELSVMQRIDRELNISLDVSKAMGITLEWAMRQSKSSAGLVGVVAENGIRVMASEGYTSQLEEYPDGVIPLTLPTIMAKAVDEGRLQRLETGQLAGQTLMESAQSQLVVPIRREAEVIGLLLLESDQHESYNEEVIDFLTRLSDHASIAISNAQLYAEVQRANLAKSDFVSFVSHELKTPMTSIRGYSDLLAAGAVGEVNEAQTEFLTTIRSNIQRMATLVSDLADVSRIEAGRLHLDFSSVDLAEVVEEVMRSTRAMYEEKAHQLALDLPEDLPLVWCDRNRIVQIITNLASNAIKYTPENGSITIHAEQSVNIWDHEGSPQVVHLSVQDTGIGIKQEDQKKIFQQYFRTDEGKETAPGTGLGLNITRELVEKQGGKIWFESEFGKGTIFHFTMPVAEKEQD